MTAFGAGALVFLVSQVILRLPWQIPLGRWVQEHQEWLIPFLLLSSLTAGLFEETGRWAGYRYLLKERSLRIGVMFGLGHGALEAILLAGLPLAGLLVAGSWHPEDCFPLGQHSKVYAIRPPPSAPGRCCSRRWSAPAQWRRMSASP